MEHLLGIYGIAAPHQIFSYATNIYALYQSMIQDGKLDDFDILMHLRSREKDPIKKELFNNNFSEIILIFDFDPQDSLFSEDKIRGMVNHFTEFTDMGKLYLNYPMVEAFYHMKSIPDSDYYSYTATMTELTDKKYKMRVNTENRNGDYTKFAVNKAECDIVISQNIIKSWRIVGKPIQTHPVDSASIAEMQLAEIKSNGVVDVLCTCAFYITDYRSDLISFCYRHGEC